MDKDDGRIYISYEAQGQLRSLAEKFNISDVAVLEMLIKDRYSVSDQHKNAQRRLTRWIGYSLVNDISESDKMIFMAGYNWGWTDFQIRHGDNPYAQELPQEK